MIKWISKTGTLKALYFLMAVDGISDYEKASFDEIGSELLGEEFKGLKETIIPECEKVIDSISVEEERYDVIQEGMDKALVEYDENEAAGVSPRLLLWDMLTVANSDSDYTGDENRLISHVVRTLEIDKSVFAEMKQLIIASRSISEEKTTLEKSPRPYQEIKPLIEEVEKRQMVIVNAAKSLIGDDEVLAAFEKKERRETKLQAASKKIGDGAGKLFSKIKGIAKLSSVTLPQKYEKIKKAPENIVIPTDATAYGMTNDNTEAFLFLFQIPGNGPLDYDNSEGLIESLHNSMEDNSGLIEVKAGNTKSGCKYIYQILKHSTASNDDMPKGNTYTFNLSILNGNTTWYMEGRFIEKGITGVRDNTIFANMKIEGLIGSDFEGWSVDPYDPDFKKGFLMNLSEQDKYDDMFQAHPLSEARRLIMFITEMN